jgi:hypothetical protein
MRTRQLVMADARRSTRGLWWRGVVVSREDAGATKSSLVFKSVGGEVDGVKEGSRAQGERMEAAGWVEV